tara:strand:- start:6668 stop:7861 length:1194 start_codon:yes stop_codon:yes gene_type:complete
MSKENENTENPFGGWDDASDVDFFGTPAVEKVEPVLDEEGKEIPAEVVKEKEIKKETVEAEDVLSTFESDTYEEEEEVDESDSLTSLFDDDDGEEKKPEAKGKGGRKVKASKITSLEMLKEKGLVDYELEEGEELTETKAEELLEDGFETSLNNKVKDLFEDMPPMVKDLNKFVLDGGSPEDFLEAYKTRGNSVITEDMDMSEEANQELVVRRGLQEEGHDEDYIETQLEFLKEKDKLEMMAEKRYNKWETNNKENKKELLKRQEDYRKSLKENERTLKGTVSTFITDNKEVNGLKFSSQDKTVLPNYMSKRNVKLENGQEITEMQRDLYTAMQDESKAILIAKLLKTDFDFSSIKNSATTDVTKKAKEELRRSKSTKQPPKAGSSMGKRKSLADYL